MMKKTFKLQGLDCANCASKMEGKIKKLEGVISATINFMTTKLTIEADDDKIEGIINASSDIIKKYEPHVEMKKS